MSDKALFTVLDVTELLSLSRSSIYEEIRRGRLRSVSIGRARRIPAEAIDDYVSLLEAEARGA